MSTRGVRRGPLPILRSLARDGDEDAALGARAVEVAEEDVLPGRQGELAVKRAVLPPS